MGPNQVRSPTCSRVEHELQVGLGAMSDLTRVVPLDLDAVDVGGVADHNAGRFRLPTAQADMGAERESGRVRFRRLGHGTSVVAFSFRHPAEAGLGGESQKRQLRG
jgi:hypothetical protein